MRIALLTDGIFPYVVGGMQRHSFYLTRYLLRAGHEVVLVHTNKSDKDIARLEVFTEEEKKRLRSIVIPFPDLGSTPGHYIRESYEYSRQAYAALKKELPVDFIYAKGFAGWETLNRKQAGDRLPPVGVNFHGYEMFQPAPSFTEWIKQRLLLRAPVLFNVRNADVVFSYGGKITELLLGIGVPRRKIAEIPTGIASDWLAEKPGSSEGPRKFVFVGRAERRKGMPELLRALKQLSGGYEMHFIGPKPAKQLKKPGVFFHGEISDVTRQRELLRGMHVLVCPSLSEGMPNVILEAMASGLAVIASDVGATAIMVRPGVNGWLIPPGDTKTLAETLRSAIAMDAQDLASLRANALALTAKEFLWETIIGTTVQKIKEYLPE